MSIPVLFGLSAVIVDVSQAVSEARTSGTAEGGGGENDITDGLLQLEPQPGDNTTNA